MTSLTVCCVLVRGHVAYSAEYVERLRSMVARHLKTPHDFVCLTDWKRKHLPRGLEILPTTPTGDVFAWWKKLELFGHPALRAGRNLYLDLDVLVVAGLEEIAGFDATLAMVPHAGTFKGRNGRAVVERFNSSVMAWDGDSHDPLWTQWRPADAKRLWGDQDWIGERAPFAGVMPLEWFPRISELREHGPGPAARVVLCKKPKNVEAAARWPWAREAWG